MVDLVHRNTPQFERRSRRQRQCKSRARSSSRGITRPRPSKLAEAAPERLSRAQGVETVLLVEDEPMLLDLGSRVLRSHGYHVLVASNATEALAVARKHAGKVDLLLTDVVMPGLPGRELAARLETVTPGLRVLYVSGYADDSVARLGAEEGVSFLAKPFSGEALAARVREVLDQAREG